MSNLYLPFDSETGGFNQSTSDMLTLYMAVMTEDFQIIDEVDLKLKPDDGRLPIAEAQALKVNKIDLRAHMADPTTITYAEGRARVETMIRKYLKKNGRFSNIRVLGYNCPFDIKWTQHHILPQDVWEDLLHYKYVDVMQNVDFLKESGWFPKELGNLGSVVDFLGLPKRSAHSAKEDTLMTIDVHKKLIEIMNSKKEGGTSQDLISLLEAE